MIKARISPDLFKPPNYAHSVLIGSCSVLFTAGGVPLDITGKLIGQDDVIEQTEQVTANLKIVLEENGFTFENVIKTTVYVVEKAENDLGNVWEKLVELGLSKYETASTLLGISQLGYPGQLVEIELIAAKTASSPNP